jgi:quercetin dioxygenase-like cupin family protein
MKTTMAMTFAALAAACNSASLVTQDQQAESKRMDLQRYDLGVAGREVVQVRVDFDPGYTSPKHRHAGEEVIFVIEGAIEYGIEGKPSKVYRAGEVLTIPYGAIHWARNVGKENGAELATYIVEKGKPLLELAE